MEKKIDLLLLTLAFAIFLLFLSSFLFYRIADKNIDFVRDLLQCDKGEEIVGSAYLQKETQI